MKLRLTFIAAVLFTAPVFSQSVDEIINGYLEITNTDWNKLESMKMEGSIAFGEMSVPFVVYAKKPNKIKVEADFQGQQLVPQAYDGTTAWRFVPFQGDQSPQKLTEEETKQTQEDAQFEPRYVNYKEKGHVITLDGTEEVDGVECYKLKLEANKNNDKDSYVEFYFFDTEENVLIMQRSYIKTGPMTGQAVETFFSDYQETDSGVIMPYYQEQRMNEQVGQKFTVTKISMNEEIEDDVFAFPATEEATEGNNE